MKAAAVRALDREELARRILALPEPARTAAAELALKKYGPAPPKTGAISYRKPDIPLAQFIRDGWDVLEPGTRFVDGWHLGAISEHLEAVTAGEIVRLVINIPPRHMKSLSTAVFWPAWEWTFAPWTRQLFASYAQALAKRDSMKTRRLITSAWYQSNWGDRFSLSTEQNEKLRFENDRTGFRLATSVEGAGTGEGGDRIVVDDPHKAGHAHSANRRERVVTWWDEEMSTRANDPKRSAFVVMMQRLHEGDLSGHVLAQGGYVHLCLPAEYRPRLVVEMREAVERGEALARERAAEAERLGLDPEEIDYTPPSEVAAEAGEAVSLAYNPARNPTDFEDPRTRGGEPLWEARIPRSKLRDFRRRLGSYGYSGQFQQSPSPPSGGEFKRWWWRFWVPKGQLSRFPPVSVRGEDGEALPAVVEELPYSFAEVLQSWDFTFKAKADSSFVVGQVLAREKANGYLLEQHRDRLTFTQSLRAMKEMTKRHPAVLAKLVEDKANGPAVIDVLRSEIPGVIAVEPDGDKMARARAYAPMLEAGNFYLPHPVLAPWVWALIDEFAAAPLGEDMDQVDAWSQGMRRLFGPAGHPYSEDDWASSRR